jgi:hypothetical protein
LRAPLIVFADATYLLKAALGFSLSIGAPPYAIGVQNEPQNSNPTYPTCLFDVDDEGAVGTKLRSLLNGSGLGGTKIVGYEHNWVNASTYPVELVRRAVFEPNGPLMSRRCKNTATHSPAVRSRASVRRS